MKTPRARTALGTALATSGLLLVAACGSGSSSSSAAAVSQAQTLQTRFVTTVKTVSPSVVEVETPVGLGSGVVFDSKGDIVTNDHVVGTYTRFGVTDSTGRLHKATLVGTFQPDDLAVIHVAGLHLRPLPFANSARLSVGDLVFAVGNPLGLQSSVTQGIVSALGRTVTEQDGAALPGAIQTSAAINPGNSGGALVDLAGHLVGIPTLAAIDSETSQLANGIGFAIPSNTVASIARQLVRYGHVVNSGRAFLGVRLATSTEGGVFVVGVTSHGPAAQAGVRVGDAITSIQGRPVETIDDIVAALADLKPGAKARVGVQTPAGASKTLTVTVGRYPAGSA